MKQFIFSALLLLCSAALQSQTYAFPFKGEDLPAGVRISTKSHADGIQALGRDIGAMKYLGNNKWTDRVDGDNSNKANDNHVVYGMEFYAMQDGEVCGCWRNAPENPQAGAERHPDFDKKLIIGGRATTCGSNMPTAPTRCTPTPFRALSPRPFARITRPCSTNRTAVTTAPRTLPRKCSFPRVAGPR
jgi:hypothetical protein